ncbi:MAG: enolase C-terminal domain-like protein [Acidimicrobiales bacterium]
MEPDPPTASPPRSARSDPPPDHPTPTVLDGDHRLERIEVHLLSLPLRQPFAAAHGTMTERLVSVVAVEAGGITGWGECSALPHAGYTREDAVSSARFLGENLAPALIGRPLAVLTERAGPVAAGSQESVGELDHPMAVAALEMAGLDVGLRAAGCSLARYLAEHHGDGRPPDTRPAGVAVGLASPDDTVQQVAALVAEGYRRVKLKIEPGHDLTVVAAVAAACPGLELQVDANGAYRADDPGHRATIEALVAGGPTWGLTALEQPFAAEAVPAAAFAVAAAGSGVRIVADEAAPDLTSVQRLAADGALSAVSVKPPRLGGLIRAAEVHDWCRATGLAATAGGMVETGLGRHALAALAALPGFTLTGDLSPAGRWLTVDPFPDLVLHSGAVTVPAGPGVAGDPNTRLLRRVTVDRWRATGG